MWTTLGLAFALMLRRGHVAVRAGPNCGSWQEGVHKIRADAVGGVEVVTASLARMPEVLKSGQGLLATTGDGTYLVAGPRARAWLTRLVKDCDRDFATLPHMHCAMGEVTGLPARLLRVSFSGEYACEIHVPAGVGADLWRRLLAESADETQPAGLKGL